MLQNRFLNLGEKFRYGKGIMAKKFFLSFLVFIAVMGPSISPGKCVAPHACIPTDVVDEVKKSSSKLGEMIKLSGWCAANYPGTVLGQGMEKCDSRYYCIVVPQAR